jgi:4,5-DOPA dioxygenase extradiol
MVETALPALYLGHGAPPLLEDPVWPGELRDWAGRLPRPAAVLMVSAHWEDAPVALSSVSRGTPLVYDFYGFPEHYYRLRYDAPTAPHLAARVRSLLSDAGPVVQTDRGLDHGAYIPLMEMYPAADVPVLQMSMPTLDPGRLLELGTRLAPLRDEGVLVVGSGFLTHGLPYIDWSDPAGPPPGWSREFDLWADAAVHARDVDALLDFAHRAPAVRYAHPRTEHLAPLFVAAGAAGSLSGDVTTEVEGYWLGLAKRSYSFS